MKKTTKTRRVSVTLHPDIAAKLDSFAEAWNSKSFPHYKFCDSLTTSEVVKFAVAHLLRDLEKAQHGLVHQGKNIEGAIESFWRSKFWWEQNSIGDEIESETSAEILSIREGMK
jgi:predicted transcriptional regulator